jgi:hypothetical protein
MDDLEVRDLFAMLALVGIIISKEEIGENDEYKAQRAYDYADAMIKEKNTSYDEEGIASVKKRKRT